MNKSLESLLVLSCLEVEGTQETAIVEAFAVTMGIFMEKKELFEHLPEIVIKSSASLQSKEEKLGSSVGLSKMMFSDPENDEDETIDYFEEKALLIYDGLHGSAFGAMNYFYRSKGVRIYLFETGEINILTPYCTIDHSGFQLRNEIWNTCGPDFSTMTTKEIRRIIHLTADNYNIFDPKQFIGGELLKMLCGIKKPFKKDYYLEYLLTPPDVDEPSDFSENIRNELWEICLSSKYRDNWGEKIQHLSMNILSSLNISPSTGQIVSFIKSASASSITSDEILKRLNEIQENIVQSQKPSDIDMFELKPNILGIGVNVNEILKRVNRYLDS